MLASTRNLLGLLAAACLAASTLAEDPPHGAAPTTGHAAPAAAAHGDEAHKPPGIWEGGIGNSIITLVIFGGVVLVLGTRAWAPLMKVLADREHAIRTSLELARGEREAAERLLAKYQAQIDHARAEATAIVDEGRRDSAEVRRRMQDDARKEADEMLARARREIQLAADTAVKEIYDHAADLAVQVASGIIRKELRAEDHKALVSESVERMKASKN